MSEQESHNLTMPPLDKLLHSERDNLQQMLRNIDGEMLQATVRRESILSVLQCIEEKIARLEEEGIPEPSTVSMPTQMEFDFSEDSEEDKKAETAN